MRSVLGQATERDQRELRRFAEVSRPSWIPETMPYDTVATLSQLRGTPRDWAHVRFVPSPNGEPWAMIVTPKGAIRREDGTSPYDQVILIPGGGAPGTGARAILDLFFHPESAGVPHDAPQWRGFSTSQLDVAERPSGQPEEPSTGYGERSDVLAQIEAMLTEWREAA